jgi:AraC-like DNA-binding protein
LRTSKLGLQRFRCDEYQDALPAAFPTQDAHVLVFQLRDHPAHDFWIDGKYAPASPAAKATLNIFDLKADPAARLIDPFDSLHFHIPRKSLDDLAEEAGAPRVDALRAPNGWDTVDPLIERMQELVIAALDRGSEGNTLFDSHLTMALHAHIAQTYGGMRALPLHGPGGLAPWQEARAKALIATDLADQTPLTQVARECGLSPAYFARAFKISVGATPHGWLQACRVARAKDLLLTSRLSLAEVASACGFADQSHFTRIFRRLAHGTPGTWRRLRLTA